MRRPGILHRRVSERGNMFAMLFAAVALTGVLAAVGMQTLTGPVTTITRVTQRNVADNNLLMDAKIIVNAAVTGTAGGDPDGDGIIEPAPYVSASVGETPPANGGFLPTDLGLSLTDPWGTKYGYCVWDHGTTNTSANRLTGDNTGSASTQAVIAIIAAGPDKIFQTTCSAYSGGPVQVVKGAGSDDIIFKYSYAEAAASSNGLWSVNVSDQAKAELKDSSGGAVNVTIDRDTGIGDFLGLTTSVISARTDETIALDGGLLLDTAGTTSDTCSAAEKGAIRLNASQIRLEICDGAGAFKSLTGGIWETDETNVWRVGGNVGIGTASPGQKLDVQGNVNASGGLTVGGTGSVTGNFLVNTDALVVDATAKKLGVGKTPVEALDVAGNAYIAGNGTVTGGLSVDTTTLVIDPANDRVGIGTDSPAHRLDIAGTTDMGEPGSFTAGDAVLHVDDGTADLYLDGRAVISNAGLIVGTTGAKSLEFVTDETQRILIGSDGTISVTGDTGISGATALWSTLAVAGNANFDSGTLFVDTAADRVGIGTMAPAVKLDVTGGVKVGTDAVCNGSKAGMIAWNTPQLQVCDGTGFKTLGAIDKLDDIGDVDVPAPNDNDVVAWNSTNNKWEAKNIAMLGPASVNPAGNDGDIQLRDGSDLGADPLLHWDKINHRLGVGTTTPGTLLNVGSSAAANPVIRLTNNAATNGSDYAAYDFGFGTTGTSYGGMSMDYSDRATTGLRFHTASGYPIALAAGGTTKLIVLSSGNVGIGTTTPQSLLHVAGGIQLGDDSASCPGSSNEKLGTLRFNGGALQLCTASGWGAVSSGSGSSGGGTVVAGWPDAIKCTGTSGSTVLNFGWQNAAGTSTIYSVASDYGDVSTNNVAKLTFSSLTAAGTLTEPSAWTNWLTNCNGKTIAQLYASGQAFNFVGGGDSSGDGGSGGGTPVAFRVNKNNADQTVPAATNTLITWSQEDLDTNNNFASNRFTPTVAGYYQVNASLRCVDGATRCDVTIRKNGGVARTAPARNRPELSA